jgi:GT2 family glycosyltransferase
MQTVSVIIPAYNAAPTIELTVRSALEQTHPPLEILVIDSGSTDDTAEIVRCIEGVTLLQREKGSPGAARNDGARHARGRWLGLLDAGDWWAPDKLARQLAAPVADDVAVIHCLSDTSGPDIPAELAFAALWERNRVITSAALVRRDVFEQVGGMDDSLAESQDYHLWMRLAALGWRFALIPEVLIWHNEGGSIPDDPEQLFRQAELNIRRVHREFDLPDAMLRRKRIQLLHETGVAALQGGQQRPARQLLGRLLRLSPTPRRLLYYAAACLPLPRPGLRRWLLPDQPGCADSSLTQPAAMARIVTGHDRPLLIVIIDTEEEFDWKSLPFYSMSVKAMHAQGRAQRIFDRFGVVPTYAVDYAVASQPEGYEPLLPFLAEGRCEIGAQLHPWINPPRLEEQTEANSYAGNLPPILEREKLRRLTDRIIANFGCRPILYRGGRYGTGQATAKTLARLGYRIDCSVMPFHDLRRQHGPNYWHAPAQPYWCAAQPDLLEIPVTAVLTGVLGRNPRPWRRAFSSLSEQLFIPAVLSRARLLERIRLTPEGVSLEEAKRMTRIAYRRDGQKVFALSYHSPSLAQGNTPYVRNEQDLAAFLAWIERYLEFFFGEMNGIASTPGEVYDLARRNGEPEARQGQGAALDPPCARGAPQL